jgi:predicted Fe-Mo cluster-binding NifX family protein
VDTETGNCSIHDNAVNLNAQQGAGIQTGRNVAELGVEAVITGNVGPNAFKTLNAAGVKIYLAGQQTIQEAVEAFKKGTLRNQYRQCRRPLGLKITERSNTMRTILTYAVFCSTIAGGRPLCNAGNLYP